LFQAIFAGAALLWFPLRGLAIDGALQGSAWTVWFQLHGAIVGISLVVAVLLTVYSLIDYLWSYRTLVGIRD
ncbi:MAG TPA: hypothetical protein VLA43_11710, partial [Longimicrobiales bacterium]|nr:hypothetical protein [Longimicrobiales bacterium]